MVLKDGNVMSKSKGNVVDPDTMLQKVGADALRTAVMFLVAPPEKEVEWSDAGSSGRHVPLAVPGVARGRPVAGRGAGGRADRGVAAGRGTGAATQDARHDRRVTADIDVRKQMNTPHFAMMELVNDLYSFTDAQRATATAQGAAAVAREAIEALTLLLSPFAPHTAEELGESHGHAGAWPRRPGRSLTRRARAEQLVVPVQVNGKVRTRLTVPADIADAELERAALADPGGVAAPGGEAGAEGRGGAGPPAGFRAVG
ncbi:MAG: class I tRNA ligase family protein [Vicinamibacterales bacterium]